MTEKDRSQILRMAGNIASGLVSKDGGQRGSMGYRHPSEDHIASIAVSIAIDIMIEVDRVINNKRNLTRKDQQHEKP